jgi:hypothetical protein
MKDLKANRATNNTDEAVTSPMPNAALSGRGPTELQETPWPVPAVRLNA